MNGLWLLPTRRRPETLQRFFDAAFKTGMSTPGVVLVNEDEYEELREKYDAVTMPLNWRIETSKEDSICRTMRGAMDLYRDLDWVGLLTDDVVPETEEWDKKLLEWNDGKTIVTCNDGMQAPHRMCGAHIFPLPLLKALGYWFPKGFYHCWVDDIWETIGRETGCWKVRMDVTVRHMHPFLPGIQADETHAHSYREDRFSHDKELFEQWKLYRKPIDIANVRKFMEEYHAATAE